MSRQYGQMESDRYPETGTSVVALELEQQQQEDPHVHITKNPRTLLSRCSLTRTCIGITALCIVICVGIILALIFTVGIKNGNNSNAVIANPDDPINGGGMAGNGTSSSGPFNNFSSSTGGGGNPNPTPIPTEFIPAAPLSYDRCTQAFPQSTINPWVSTATCDQCTTAGCGWCTIPVKQSDGSTRYFTSCREKNAAGTADIGGVCIENTIPTTFKAFPAGKSTVFANAPSSSTTGLTCRAAELAEHPSTPSYPPSTDKCHTVRNARSCSACVDYTNNTFTITVNATCGWLTLPITIDGVTRWYTSCRNATFAETATARNTPVNLPAGKTKIWALNPIGAALPNTIGSCREPALADAPYTPAPYLASAADICSQQTTCVECGDIPGCGWCSTPKIGVNGSVTVITSCRAGSLSGSKDGACTLRDPRVPATWWGYHIYQTWLTASTSPSGTCPSNITQNPTTPSSDYLDNTPAAATIQNYIFRSTLGCPKITDCTACLQNFRCGWCGYRSTGRCVPSYTSYGPTSGTRVTVDYSPLCAAPDISLEWTGCSTVPTLRPNTTTAPPTTPNPTTRAPTTKAPTTVAPTTLAPTTLAPTTTPPTPTPTPNPTSTPRPGPTGPPFIPAAPLANDRCTQAFPQSTIYPWVSTATCDQCTNAGCGWCTIPVLQSDGSTRYFTSCREKNAAGTADIGGFCDESTIPEAFKAFPSGKSEVFANAPSSSTTGLTCRAAELAEHPSTPAYPPSTDNCHTLINSRSCSACVDYTNNTFTITTTSKCGWLTLPITIDGVTRWYTSCRNATATQTIAAKNTPVNLPAGKSKTWAQNPIGAGLPNTLGSCRESALADAPYTPAPYLAPAADACASKTTCGECGATPGCGWCSIPSIAANGSVTVLTSCRAGTTTGSLDGACTVRDPRVPATWWGYNIYRTWVQSINGTCPPPITQNGTTPATAYLDNTPAVATTQNFVFRSTLGCPALTDCTACLRNYRCGWCGYLSTGRCVPSYTSYGGSTSSTRVTVDYSPICAAPEISLEWTGCSSVPTN